MPLDLRLGWIVFGTDLIPQSIRERPNKTIELRLNSCARNRPCMMSS